MTSLNPYMRVGEQLMEVLMLHKGMSKAEAFEESVRMLDAVKMPEARKRMKMYPHEFSGGMRQRVMIAMALLCLLNAVPRLDAEGETMLTIPGNPPNLLRLPKGCPFQPRCPYAMEICSSTPPLEEFSPGRLRACFKPVEELV